MRFSTARVPAAAALLALLAATACCQGAAAAPLIWGGEAATAPSYDALQPPNYLPSPSSAPAAEAAEALTLTRAAVRRRLHLSTDGQGGHRLQASLSPSAGPSYGASFSPTASPPPPYKGEFSISGLPTEAFVNGTLSPSSVGALSSALNSVVKRTCANCTATILTVVDAADPNKSYLPSRRRRLQTSSPNLKVTFRVDGSAENIVTLTAALAAAPPTAFAADLATQLQTDKQWTVSVVLLSVPPASSNSPPPVNVGAIAGGIAGGVVALGIIIYCWSSRGGPSSKVASSEPTKPKV